MASERSESRCDTEIWFPNRFFDWNPSSCQYYVSDFVDFDRHSRRVPDPSDQLCRRAPWNLEGPLQDGAWNDSHVFPIEKLCHCTHEDRLEQIARIVQDDDGMDEMALFFKGRPKKPRHTETSYCNVDRQLYQLEDVGALSWWHVYLRDQDIDELRSERWNSTWGEDSEEGPESTVTWGVDGFGMSGPFDRTSRYGEFCITVDFDTMIREYAKVLNRRIADLAFFNGGTLIYKQEVQHNVIVAPRDHTGPQLVEFPHVAKSTSTSDPSQFSVTSFADRKGFDCQIKMRSSTSILNFKANGPIGWYPFNREQYFQQVALAFWLPDSAPFIKLRDDDCSLKIVDHSLLCVRPLGETRCPVYRRPERTPEKTAERIQTLIQRVETQRDNTLKPLSLWIEKVKRDNQHLFDSM